MHKEGRKGLREEIRFKEGRRLAGGEKRKMWVTALLLHVCVCVCFACRFALLALPPLELCEARRSYSIAKQSNNPPFTHIVLHTYLHYITLRRLFIRYNDVTPSWPFSMRKISSCKIMSGVNIFLHIPRKGGSRMCHEICDNSFVVQ